MELEPGVLMRTRRGGLPTVGPARCCSWKRGEVIIGAVPWHSGRCLAGRVNKKLLLCGSGVETRDAAIDESLVLSDSFPF